MTEKTMKLSTDIKTRICTYCQINKSIENFYKYKDDYLFRCKECLSIRQKEKRLKNKKPVYYGPEYKRTCTKCKIEKIIPGNFNKHKNHPLGISLWCKECANLADKKRRYTNINLAREKEKLWQSNNKAWVNSYKRIWHKKKIENSKNANVNYYTGLSISQYISKNTQSKNKFLNFTSKDLKTHLESKFTKGMNWENYGKTGWHVDHVIPLSFFKHDGDKNHPAFKYCWSLENLQPLWSTTKVAIEHGEEPSYIGNLEKNNKVKITNKMKKLLDKVNNGKT